MILQIGDDHLTGPEASFFFDAFRVHFQCARFRRGDDQIVVRDQIRRGPQTIAVERHSRDAAIGKTERGGTVPRLHQRRVIMIKRFDFRMQVAHIFPRFGNEHHHRVRQFASAHRNEFERIIQNSRIRRRQIQQRLYRTFAVPFVAAKRSARMGAQERRIEIGRARVHPRNVARQRIYFAVMTHRAKRLREFPRRKSVGAVTLMRQRERGFEQRILQIKIKGAQRRRDKQTFVHDRARGQRRQIERFNLRLRRAAFQLFARQIERAFKRVAAADMFAARQ
ncbi:MAG: hypothetical protein HDKAJFGB_02043 [Anaerolineae bacterium]|nr:hypothetical protein [Anaerolineae bacterium]